MKGNVSAAQAVTRIEHPLPARVQEALGELVGVAQKGLLALSVGVGLGVLAELMEEEVTEIVGPKGRHDPERGAVRHGREGGKVTLGGRRVPIERPRVRAADDSGEMALSVYRHFADRDPLSRIVLERMLAGVSCQRYERTQEPVGEQIERQARGVSKSAISRTFIERTREALRRADGPPPRRRAPGRPDVRRHRAEGTHQRRGARDHQRWPHDPARALRRDRPRTPPWATALLALLVERGPGTTQGVLCVLDGSKALRKAVRDVLGERSPVERSHPPQGAQHPRSPA